MTLRDDGTCSDPHCQLCLFYRQFERPIEELRVSLRNQMDDVASGEVWPEDE